MTELNVHELEIQYGELLPEREALSAFWTHIDATNVAAGVQTLTALSANITTATQAIVVG